MENKTIMWVIISVLIVAVTFSTFKVAKMGTAESSGTGKIDTAGWTQNEIMNYEMHGTIPARVSGGSAPASSGMVGGC